MTPSDIKKITLTFLALAVVVGSLVFIASKAPSNRNSEELFTAETGGDKKIAQVGENAFVEKLDSLSPRPETNLTDTLAQSFADEILKLNPEGPEKEGAGSVVTTPPTNVVVDSFINNPAVVKTVVARSNIITPRVRTIEETSPEKVSAYLEAIQNIADAKIANPQLSRIFAASPTSETLIAAELALGEIVTSLSETAVPKQYERLHTELIKTFAYAEQITESSTSDDPFFALVETEQQIALLESSFNSVEAELERLEFPAVKTGGSRSPFHAFLGIPVAHAQWAVFDGAVFGALVKEQVHGIMKWLRTLATEFIKDRLVHRLVQQTINWIQGGGKPQFVTNWKGFLGDAAKAAESDIITSIAPRLCRSFGPLIQVSLLPVNTTPEKAITCTLDQVVSNIRDFAQSFKNGGWIAYGASLEAQNNVFGAFILASDLALAKKAEAEKAAEAEGAAGGGFLSTKKCVKPISPFDSCMKKCDATGGDGLTACRSSCQLLSSAKTMCEPDGWTITTPGDTLAGITQQSFAAPLLRIVNAQDLAALTNALLNAGLTKLVDLAKRDDGRPGQSGKGLTDINTSQLGGSGGIGDLCASVPREQRAECEAQACTGLTGEELTECQNGLVAGRPQEEVWESVCNVNMGEQELSDTPRGSSGDRTAQDGVFCDNENFTISQTQAIRIGCRGNGFAFISRTLDRCNAVPGSPSEPGWTFNGQSATNNSGQPVDFVQMVACGQSEIFAIDPGTYSIGAWTTDPGNPAAAAVCSAYYTTPPPQVAAP